MKNVRDFLAGAASSAGGGFRRDAGDLAGRRRSAISSGRHNPPRRHWWPRATLNPGRQRGSFFLLHLVELRASHLDGAAFCIDIHVADAVTCLPGAASPTPRRGGPLHFSDGEVVKLTM